MKEPIATQAPKVAQTESSQGGLTMAAPEFKLLATSKDTDKPLSEAEPLEEFKGSKAANFGVMSFQIERCKQEEGIFPILIALEALKRNPRQAAEFLAYFATKNGTGLFEYLAEKFGKSQADEVKALLDFGVAVDPNSLVADFHAAIEAEDESTLMALLMKVDKLDALNAAYKARFPGEDLLLSLHELGADRPLLAEMVDDVSGAYQNFERLAVRNSDEATEARKIIARIYDKYHVEINSQEAAYFVKNYQDKATDGQKAQIKTSAWKLEELKQVEMALEKFAPILGESRYESTRSDEDQELMRLGRVNQDIGLNSKKEPQINPSTAGVTYIGNYLTAIFDNASNTIYDKGIDPVKDDPVSTFGRTVTHELGHAFFQYAIHEFEKEAGFWISPQVHWPTTPFVDLAGKKHTSISLKSGDDDSIELPATEYGCENVGEDLSETVMLYLTNRAQLENGSEKWKQLSAENPDMLFVGNPCPKRIAFLDRKIAEWKQEEK